MYNLNGTGETWITTTLYDKLKNNFKPRIQGTYGNCLNKLAYTGQFISKARRAISPLQENADSSVLHDKRLSMIIFNNLPLAHHYHHVGFFNDLIDTVNHRYFLLVNAFPKVSNASDDILHLNFVPPDTTLFKNFRFRNVEGGMDTNFSGPFSGTVNIHGGDGKLFQVAPTLRMGGILNSNDEVKNTEYLLENLRILTSDTLLITGNYYLRAAMHVDSGASLKQTGYIFIDSLGSVSVSKWENALIKSRSSNYPRLIWADYPLQDSIINFKIFRKKQDTTFSLIATLSSSAREYIDSATTIVEGTLTNNETFSDYYVSVTILIPGGRYQIASYNSNSVSYNRVEGFVPEKEGHNWTSIKEFEYSLSQNYPNPFNPETAISFSIKRQGLTTLRIYDIRGKMLDELVNSVLSAGEYSVNYRPRSSLSSGIYFVELISGTYRSYKKSIYIK